MDRQELTKLREQILGDIAPMILDSVELGADRFSLLLRLIQSGGADAAIYKKAYESAKAIEDKGEQLNALLALLDEIDFDVQKEEVNLPQDEQRAPVSMQPQPEADENISPQPVENTQY
jgi:hypothetical protein